MINLEGIFVFLNGNKWVECKNATVNKEIRRSALLVPILLNGYITIDVFTHKKLVFYQTRLNFWKGIDMPNVVLDILKGVNYCIYNK